MKDNIRALIELLMQATKEKKLTWRTDRDASYLTAKIPGGVIELLQHPTGDGFNLLVRNAQDILLDQTGYLSHKAGPELAELYREARNSVMKTDEQLSNIISGLRQQLQGN